MLRNSVAHLEELSELGIPERNVLLAFHEGIDNTAQGQEGAVDIGTLHRPDGSSVGSQSSL